MHGGDVWKYAQQYKGRVAEILDFSANINPLGAPDGVRKALAHSLEDIAFYPEPQARTLRAALAACYGVDPREVIVGNGAAELIFLYCRAREGMHAVQPVPTFSEYALACRAAGGQVRSFPLAETDAFSLPASAFLQWFHREEQKSTAGHANAGGDKTAFLCHPNNPTGRLLPQAELQQLVEGLLAAGAGVFLDLSFLGFIPGQRLENGTMPAVPLDYFREIINSRFPGSLFLLFSFTKLFALPGVRLGFAIGPRDLVAAMEKMRDPWTVNTMAQCAGLQCLRESEYVDKSVSLITAAREELASGLARIGGIKVFPGTANFLLCHLRELKVKASDLVAALAAKGILVRSAADFPGLDPYYFRLAVRRPAENALLLQRLDAFLKKRNI